MLLFGGFLCFSKNLVAKKLVAEKGNLDCHEFHLISNEMSFGNYVGSLFTEQDGGFGIGRSASNMVSISKSASNTTHKSVMVCLMSQISKILW